jgi:leader peptidase (prepilin peptidase)/N-methyltransferase
MFLVLFLLGLALGAGLNQLADDLPHRSRPGRPHCPQCGREYDPRQWLSLAAWPTGRRRCAQCGAPQAWRRPIVELTSALMLVFLYNRFGAAPRALLLGLLLECLLLITVIDLEHRLILYVTIFPAALAALLYGLFGTGGEWPQTLSRSLIGGLAGFGVFYAFYLLGFVYSALVASRRGAPLDEVAFGGGDANLGGVVGLAVGWPAMILTIVYAVVAGGLIAGLILLIMSARRRNALLVPIPYGPFIVLGAVAVLVFGTEVRRFYGFAP